MTCAVLNGGGVVVVVATMTLVGGARDEQRIGVVHCHGGVA